MAKKAKESGSDKKSKESSSDTNFKYYFFLALFMFPTLAWVISVAGDVLNNIGGVFGSIANGILIALPVILPIIIAIYSKKLRSLMLRVVLPVAVGVLIFPTIQVYLCSPIDLKNEDLGTKHSLQASAERFLKDSCMEHCLGKSRIPSAYQLSIFSPRVAIRVHYRQIIDLNLTTSARVGGEIVKIARLLLVPSWRSVKGRYHALNLVARIPLKVKKLGPALQAKSDMIMVGKVVNMPNDLKRLKGELEKQKRFVRPIMLEVFRITPIEKAEDSKTDEKGSHTDEKGSHTDEKGSHTDEKDSHADESEELNIDENEELHVQNVDESED